MNQILNLDLYLNRHLGKIYVEFKFLSTEFKL